MSLAKITMIGMEEWLNHFDKSLFDLFVLPEDVDRDNCIDNIMLECGEFETLYSDPEFMRAAIGTWSKKHYRTFDKWAKALKLEYSPLENYDRIEDWWDYSEKDNDNTRTLDHQDKRTLDTQNKRTLDTQNKRTLDTENKRTLDTQDEETRDISDETTYDKTTTTENEVSAFDSSSYQPADKSTMDEDGTVTVDGTGTDTFTHTGTDTMNNTGTDTLDNTGTDTLDNTGTDTVDYSGTIKDEGGETVNSSHGGRIHGNVGVTTSQQMLQSELDIARFNLINQITDLFLTELCICVYE